MGSDEFYSHNFSPCLLFTDILLILCTYMVYYYLVAQTVFKNYKIGVKLFAKKHSYFHEPLFLLNFQETDTYISGALPGKAGKAGKAAALP